MPDDREIWIPYIFHIQLIISAHNILSTDYCYVCYFILKLFFLMLGDLDIGGYY